MFKWYIRFYNWFHAYRMRKAKQILKNSTQKSIPYSLIDSEKSCNFINALPGFSQSNNCLVRKG